MKTWLVYKHTSIRSNKSYIGVTSRSMEDRWQEHVGSASTGSSRHFHRAIRLYGAGNWVHEVITDEIDTLEEAYTLEKYYIKKYDAFENGYNLTEGGEGNPGLRLDVYKEVHTWAHSKHGTLTCTAEELISKYDLARTSMYSYLRSDGSPKSSKQVQGWVIKGKHSLPKKKWTKETLVVAYHDKYGKFTGTLAELSGITGKEVKHLGKLFKGVSKVVAGWRSTEHKKELVTSNKKVYVSCNNELVHTYGSSFEASLDLGLRKEQMSEWLAHNREKEINSKTYSYVEPIIKGDNE